MVTWEDWKTVDLAEKNCEVVDNAAIGRGYFYRAAEAKGE